MKKYKTLFADLDGTLIDTVSGKTFPQGIWDMRLCLRTLDAIKRLGPERILIVSNQGGIEKGFVNINAFNTKLNYIIAAIKEYCGCEVYADYCVSNSKDDPMRKPNTGMLENLLQFHLGSLDEEVKKNCLMIGDASGLEGQFSDSDLRTADNFGIDYMDAEAFVLLMLGPNNTIDDEKE